MALGWRLHPHMHGTPAQPTSRRLLLAGFLSRRRDGFTLEAAPAYPHGTPPLPRSRSVSAAFCHKLLCIFRFRQTTLRELHLGWRWFSSMQQQLLRWKHSAVGGSGVSDVGPAAGLYMSPCQP
ncbi:uncharacterized protein LOC144102735 [Amblyomma americanum]